MTDDVDHQRANRVPLTGDAHRTDLHLVLYGDSNCNLVDGATVWLQSTVQVLVAFGLDTFELVLKAPVDRDVITAPLAADERVELVEPDELLTSAAAAQAVAARAPDVVLVRGSRVSLEMARLPELQGRLWTYLTDIPQHPLVATPEQVDELRRIVDASEVLLCQTDGLRSLLEALVPAACGRTAVFPPMLPLDVMPHRRRSLGDGTTTPVRLAYAGKFAPRWRTLEMTRLPGQLADAGIDAEVEFIGDKLHPGSAGPAYRTQMREALEDSPGVDWVGALPREATFARLAEADFGLAWRDPELDVSLELSTKLLEYGALRLPALLNRTDEHEALFGTDYPLYVASADDIVAAVRTCLADPTRHALAVDRLASVAEEHSFGAAGRRLARVLARLHPAPTSHRSQRPTRLLVASHDLRFFEPIRDHLAALPSVDLRHDRWEHLWSHDADASQRALADADVVFCEWAGPNAVWYARHVQPVQRLVVRLHRFELYKDWPAQLDIDAIHTIVCVNDRYRRLALERFDWPADKVVVVPNFVDHLALDRPKVPDAAFRLGMVGISSRRKRFDLALDVLSGLRERDRRFTLAVKSALPPDEDWVWSRRDERRHWRETSARLEDDPLLRDAVHLDPYGPEVGHWLRRVGWVLSTSDDESFHLATAEGMASGAVPVVRDWEGADGIYDRRWVHSSVQSMVDAVAGGALGGTWTDLAAAARAQAEPWDLRRVARRFEQLLLG